MSPDTAALVETRIAEREAREAAYGAQFPAAFGKLWPEVDDPKLLRDRVIWLELQAASLEGQLADREELIKQQQAVIARLQETYGTRQALRMQVLRNRAIKQQALFGIGVVDAYTSRRSRGEGDEQGWVRMSRDELAELGAVGKSTASKYLTLLGEWGMVERQIRQKLVEQVPDPETGEVREPKLERESWLRLPGSDLEVLQMLAALHPERPATWGGKRLPKCSEHPDAEVIVSKRYTCRECGRLLGIVGEVDEPDPEEGEGSERANRGNGSTSKEATEPMSQDETFYTYSNSKSHLETLDCSAGCFDGAWWAGLDSDRDGPDQGMGEEETV